MLVQALRKVGTANPLILLDELDKVGTSNFHGDPSAALLETLDPAQNWSFHDHYLGDVAIDLSQVMFIATANTLETISPPLLDRCEVIECPGYVTDEKLAIARKFLLPRQVKECGLDEDKVQMGDEALLRVILDYTREVRLVTSTRMVFSRADPIPRRQEYGRSSGNWAKCVAPKQCNSRQAMQPGRTIQKSPRKMSSIFWAWPSLTKRSAKRVSDLESRRTSCLFAADHIFSVGTRSSRTHPYSQGHGIPRIGHGWHPLTRVYTRARRAGQAGPHWQSGRCDQRKRRARPNMGQVPLGCFGHHLASFRRPAQRRRYSCTSSL